MNELEREIDEKFKKEISKYTQKVLSDIICKIEEIPIKYPPLESDEYDAGLKDMREKIIKLIEESI
jgi:hypothetical protein